MDGHRDRQHHKGSHGKGHGKAKKSRPSNSAGKKSSFPWINSQIISASESGDIHYLMSTIMSHLPHMNLVNLSTALHRLAKLAATDSHLQATLCNHEALQTLLETICLSFSGLDASEVQPQSISNVVWSLATMRYIDKHLLQALTHLTVSNIDQFKPFELSTTLWALAKLGSVDNISNQIKPVFQAAAQHITPLVSQFGFRCLATTAWAFATSKQRHARLFRAMAAQMLPMAQNANCQEMANTAWAFGTADFHDDQLFHELAEKAVYMLAEFKPQELSNMLWGFASNGFFHEEFFASAAAVARQMDLQAQHLANILWAFARVRPRHHLTRSTIQTLIPNCTELLHTFKPQEVSSTALAVGKAMGLRSEDGEEFVACDLHSLPREVVTFFDACLDWVAPRLHEFSVQSLANTVSAYTMVPVPGARGLFDEVGIEVMQRFEDLEMASVLHLLKAFVATPRGCGARVTSRLATNVAKHLSALKPQELQTVMRICHQFEASTTIGGMMAVSGGNMGGPKPSAQEMSLHEMHRLLMGLATADSEAEIPEVIPRHASLGYHRSHPPGKHRAPLKLRASAHPQHANMHDDLWEDKVHPDLTGSWEQAIVDRQYQDLWMHSQQQRDIRGGARQPLRNRPRKRGEASAGRVNAASLQELVGAHPGLCTISEASMPYSSASHHKALSDPAIMAMSEGHTVLSLEQQAGMTSSSSRAAQALDPSIVEISTDGRTGPCLNALMMQGAGMPPPYAAHQVHAMGHGAGMIADMARHGVPAHPEDNPFLAYQMARRGKMDRNAEHKWSVKNSFLHLESSDSDGEAGEDTHDGNSSQRSSSAPSTMSRAEYREFRFGEAPRRHPVQEAMMADASLHRQAYAAGAVMPPHGPAPSNLSLADASGPSSLWPCGTGAAMALPPYTEHGFLA
eukprot:TRINITY_DN3785_c0_g2_i2.p1 TRINITY_DN3785_c0_g2~~TRINITY_DN3785_c0_g2_i2.p1  ORF type:complete len:912 (+),score=166.54 TRINITY_DN3785_c0_g2_i2:41-2776(+)